MYSSINVMDVPGEEFLMIQANAGKIPLKDKSVHCVVTSPPYFGLRKYEGGEAQIGLEPTPDEYVTAIVAVFREVRRILRDDGICWLVLGDSYNSGSGSGNQSGILRYQEKHTYAEGKQHQEIKKYPTKTWGLKPKDQLFIPHRVAMALQADGWYLRFAIPWLKANPMPESVQDRPGTSHEYVFLLTKKPKYFYDHYAVRVSSSPDSHGGGIPGTHRYSAKAGRNDSGDMGKLSPDGQRNWRSIDSFFDSLDAYISHLQQVRDNGGMMLDEIGDPAALLINTVPSGEDHYAAYPPKLIEPMIKASTSEHGVCSECGSQYIRVVEKERSPIVDTTSPKDVAREAMGLQGSKTGLQQAGWRKRSLATSKTVGWQPSCNCGHENVVPATVFDPFLGSGTTSIVAKNLGRRAVGLDLSYEYCQMARRRMAVDFNEGETIPDKVVAEDDLTPMELLIRDTTKTRESNQTRTELA